MRAHRKTRLSFVDQWVTISWRGAWPYAMRALSPFCAASKAFFSSSHSASDSELSKPITNSSVRYIGNGVLLALDIVVDVAEFVVESGGAESDYIVTRLAAIFAVVFVVVVFVDGEGNVSGGDNVDGLVIAAGSLDPGLGDADGRVVRSRAMKVGSNKGTESKNLLTACLISRDSWIRRGSRGCRARR